MADNSVALFDSGFDNRTSKTLNIFWIGFIVYSAFFTLSITTVVNYFVCQLFQIVGILLLVPAAVKLIRWKFESNYLQILFYLYCSWLLFVIVRGFSFDYNDVKSKLFDVDGGLFRYFVPLSILLPLNLSYLKKVFKVIVAFGLLFFLYDIVFYNNLLNLNYANDDTKFTFEYFTKVLSVPSGFILLTFLYHTKRRKLLAAFVIGVSTAFSVIRARRTLIFMTVIPIVMTYMLYLRAGRQKFTLIFLSVFLGAFLIIYGVKVYQENRGGVFGLLTERIYEDTRSNVEECLYEDMTDEEWIIGKGINGSITARE